jgi:lipopolysaccharide export system protein LptC
MSNQDPHTRLVGWLKIVLPLLALAILSTLFLVARTVDPEGAIPYATVDVADRLREPRMVDPTYAGVTADGASLMLMAAEARPDKGAESPGNAKSLTGSLETPDGSRTDLVAALASIDGIGRKITLSGGVDIRTSSGWTVQSESLTAAMDQTEIEAVTPVTAAGPAGTVTANAMRLTQNPSDPGRYLLVFNGAVKLVYVPGN